MTPDTVQRLTFLGWLSTPLVLAVLVILWDAWKERGRVRRFWCRDAGRDVEVLFVGNHVRACSAFEPMHAITCERNCRNAAYRRQASRRGR